MARLNATVVRRSAIDSETIKDALEGNTSNEKTFSSKTGPTFSDIPIIEIPTHLLKPYPKNHLLRLTGIEDLALSIHKTILIHAIVVAVDPDNEGYFYIISGNRRTEAYKLNQSLYPNEDKYLKIPSQIIPDRYDSKRAEEIWFDSNFETRQLSIEDGIKNIQVILEDVEHMSKEQRIELNKKLKGDKFEEYVKSNPGKEAQINYGEYIYNRFKNLGIKGWSESTIKNYMAIMQRGIPELREAILNYQIPLRYGLKIILFSNEEQKDLIDMYNSNPSKFESTVKNPPTTKKAIPKDLFVNEEKQVKDIYLKLTRNITLIKISRGPISENTRKALISMHQTIKSLLDDLEKELKEIEDKI